MALTLPYPSLTFVPLDKLTAEEMNQIVSNYQAIANQFPLSASQIGSGAIGSSQLANSAVSSSKLDWASFGFAHVGPVILNQSITTTSRSIIYLDVPKIPAGAQFMVIGFLQSNVDSDDVSGVTMEFQYNGVKAGGEVFAGTWGTPCHAFSVYTKVASDSRIYMYAQKDNSVAVTAQRASMFAFRVG